jgi:hypothetical protein
LDDLTRIAEVAHRAPRYAMPSGNLVGHGDFPEALSAYACAFIDLYAGQTRLIKTVTSPARYGIIGYIMSLHAFRDPCDPASGATAGQVQTLAAATRIASPGRVSAILSNFVTNGFVTTEAVPGDRRRRRIVPATPLLDHRARWLNIYLDTLERLRPGCGYASLFARAPEFGWAWQREWMIQATQLAGVPKGNEDILAFVMRDGGQLLLMRLLGAMKGGGITTLPYSDGPAMLGLSRQHVANFVTDLAAAGFATVESEGGHSIRLAPDFVSRYRRMMAVLFEAIGDVCERAAQEVAPAASGLSSVA